MRETLHYSYISPFKVLNDIPASHFRLQSHFCDRVRVLRELEAKFKIDCGYLGGFSDRLKASGFKFMGEHVEEDLYFSHPCRDFMASDEALRLRVSGGSYILTYKGPRVGGTFKERVEVNVSVGSEIRGVLEALGFTPALVVVKRRAYYERGDVIVSLDIVEGLGCFVEIESRRSEAIASIMSELGLAWEDYVDKTYVELLLAFGDPDRSHPSY